MQNYVECPEIGVAKMAMVWIHTTAIAAHSLEAKPNVKNKAGHVFL